MKKFLSLMLTLALIITTLALPITASAADISLQAVGTNMIKLTYELTYPDSLSAVRPGDSFGVKVVANVTQGTISSFNEASFKLQYDARLFDYVSDSTETDGTVQKSSDGIIHYDYTGGDLAVTDGKVVLATLNFNVKDTAFASLSKFMSVNDPDTNFVENNSSLGYYAFSENNLSETQLEVSVENNTATAFIDNAEITKDKTYYNTEGVTVTYEATNLKSATITKEGSENAINIPAAGYKISETGSYTVKIAVKGGLEKVYNFRVSTADVAALLDLTGTVNDTGYEYGEVITLPVKVSGLAGETADIISFDVNYDKNKFDLAVEGEGAVLKIGTDGSLDSVVYGEADGNDITVSGEEEATVATLKFTVKSDIAYGDNELKIENAKMALVKSGIDPSADKINISTAKKTITVVPTGEYVTIGEGKKTDWDSNCSGAGYTQKVTVPENVDVRYTAVVNQTTPGVNSQTGLASLFNSANELANGFMTIDKEADYYIITKIGSVYVYKKLTNGTDIFYDGTVPILNVSKVEMSDWAKDKTINLADIEASDALSQVDKYEYSIDNGTNFTALSEAGYTFEETFNGSVTIKVTDKAGNSTTANAAIKVDKTVPTATISAGAQASGKKELTITATDDHSGIDTKVVSYSATEDGDYQTITADESGTYYATVDGWYKVVVTDKVGNTAEAKVEVKLDKISGTSDINVTVVKGGTAVKNGFLTKDAMTAKGIKNRDGETLDTNGTFTYVKITVDMPQDSTKYQNEVQLKTDDGEFTTVEDGIVELSKVGTYEVKVITQNKNVADDNAASVYAFSIVKPENMLSVNADKRYNIIDHAYIKKAIGNTDTGVLPTAESGFWGGYFSGDVTGDLTMTSADLTAIINSLRAGQTPGNYDFAIMNMTQSTGE